MYYARYNNIKQRQKKQDIAEAKDNAWCKRDMRGGEKIDLGSISYFFLNKKVWFSTVIKKNMQQP